MLLVCLCPFKNYSLTHPLTQTIWWNMQLALNAVKNEESISTSILL